MPVMAARHGEGQTHVASHMSQHKHQGSPLKADQGHRTASYQHHCVSKTDIKRRVDIIGTDVASHHHPTHGRLHSIQPDDVRRSPHGKLAGKLTQPDAQRSIQGASPGKRTTKSSPQPNHSHSRQPVASFKSPLSKNRNTDDPSYTAAVTRGVQGVRPMSAQRGSRRNSPLFAAGPTAEGIIYEDVDDYDQGMHNDMCLLMVWDLSSGVLRILHDTMQSSSNARRQPRMNMQQVASGIEAALQRLSLTSRTLRVLIGNSWSHRGYAHGATSSPEYCQQSMSSDVGASLVIGTQGSAVPPLWLTLGQLEKLADLRAPCESGQRLGSADPTPWRFHPELAPFSGASNVTMTLNACCDRGYGDGVICAQSVAYTDHRVTSTQSGTRTQEHHVSCHMRSTDYHAGDTDWMLTAVHDNYRRTVFFMVYPASACEHDLRSRCERKYDMLQSTPGSCGQYVM